MKERYKLILKHDMVYEDYEIELEDPITVEYWVLGSKDTVPGPIIVNEMLRKLTNYVLSLKTSSEGRCEE